MHNPNSAVERIKNHLAYKLGQAMIEYNKNGGGYLTLFKKLYNIKKQHKKEKQIYQETIKVFPTLKYPELKQCPDYNEALKCYFHLSYMLGEALIKSYQSWYRGGGFKLYSYIKKANKEFKLFQDIFKEFDQINSNVIKAIANNKQLFLKEFPKIKNLLNIHKDYQPIIDNIFHNFDYVIKKINLIEEWLLSNDFNEKYKKENHPYPSLLDPKKLNDEKEKINYKTIPAELAWEMNLPLPDNYEFVFWGSHGVGNFGFHNIMKYCGMIALYFFHVFDSKKSYIEFYNKLNFISKRYYIAIRDYSPLSTKCFYLIFKDSICLVRDPISCLKHHLNYKWPSKSYMDTVFLNQKPKVFLHNRIAYVANNGISDKPSLKAIERIIQARIPYFHDSSLKKHLKGIKKTYFLDMNEIVGIKTLSTIEKLSQKFTLEKPIAEDSFYDFNFGSYVNMLPIRINISQRFNLEKELLISIVYKGFNISLTEIDKQFINIDKILSIQSDHFSCLVLNEHYGLFLEKLKQKDLIYIKSYIEVLFLAIEKQKQIEDGKRIIEKDILNYFKENKELAKEFKRILDTEHLSYIKQHRPDIVASWKYYQEFEKICEELDS